MCLDEILAWFQARNFGSELNKGFAIFATQARKRGLDLFWSGQWFRQGEIILREITQWKIECEGRRIFCPEAHANEEDVCATCEYWSIMTLFRAPFLLHQAPINRTAIRQEPVWAMYDTNEIIQPPKQARRERSGRKKKVS